MFDDLAQSIRAIGRRAARADSFEAWRLLDESATAAAALPYTREAYLSFQLRLYDTDHKGTESASEWHCGHASIAKTMAKAKSGVAKIARALKRTPGATTVMAAKLGITLSMRD